MRNFYLSVAMIAGVAVGSAAQAQSAGNLIGAPVTGAGTAINGLANAHAGIAPTVNQVSPTVEPATDGVTNAIAAVGSGVQGTGGRASQDGVLVGQTSNGRPLASVGATQPGNQGSVAAVLNGRP